MKLKAHIILSILIFFVAIFSFQSVDAQLFDYELGDTETLAVEEKLQSVTGRIIQVVHAKEFTVVINMCSAILIGQDTILSAGHCFKRNPLMSTFDLEQIAEMQISSEEFYFDIPGVTSKNLGLSIESISEKDSIKVLNKNAAALNIILSDLPKITNPQVPIQYENNIPVEIDISNPITEKEVLILSKNHTWNYLGNVYDVSIAKLNRKLPDPHVSIGEVDTNNTTVYATGFYGGNLSERLRVFKCKNDRSVIGKLLPYIDLDTFINLLSSANRLIISLCDGEILPGQSGGPQVQYIHGNIILVGVNSATLFGRTDYVVSPQLNSFKNDFIFSSLVLPFSSARK